MSTDPGLWVTIMVLLLCLSVIVAGLLGYRIGYHEGAHDGRTAEKQRWLDRDTRHASRVLDTRLTSFPQPVIRAKTGPLPRVITTWGDRAPQLLPQPGRFSYDEFMAEVDKNTDDLTGEKTGNPAAVS